MDRVFGLAMMIGKLKQILIDFLINSLIIIALIGCCIGIPYLFMAIGLTWPQSLFYGGWCILMLGGVTFLLKDILNSRVYMVLGILMGLVGIAVKIYACQIAS